MQLVIVCRQYITVQFVFSAAMSFCTSIRSRRLFNLHPGTLTPFSPLRTSVPQTNLLHRVLPLERVLTARIGRRLFRRRTLERNGSDDDKALLERVETLYRWGVWERRGRECISWSTGLAVY